MEIASRVIEHSIAAHHSKPLITMHWTYPRFIHGEVMTHRVFSRNAMSSRAVPVKKIIDQVRNDPVVPIHWGRNQPGMQAETVFEGKDAEACEYAWRVAARNAANVAEQMAEFGLHKQIANRILEPFQWMHTIVTATEWENFEELRDHKDAEPHMRRLAVVALESMRNSDPILRYGTREEQAAWHLPYVTAEERIIYRTSPRFLAKLSAARCARVSYLNHDGSTPVIEKDIGLYDLLVGSRPLHASPVEHQGYPLPLGTQTSKNFVGWRQHRELVEAEVWANAA